MAKAARPSSMKPEEFRPNQTWLAFRITAGRVRTGESEHDIFVLQDAGSMFIFGTALAPFDGDGPSEAEVSALLEKAWAHREEWPEVLLVPGRDTSGSVFARVAEQNGVASRAVPEARMSFYIRDVQSSFREYFSEGSSDV